MNYYLISNLQTYGSYDYKGLDISQFLAGSQVYNSIDNEFAVVSTEDIEAGTDVTKLTEVEYASYRESHKPISPVDQIQELTNRQGEIELAMFELASIIGGGA